MDKVYAVVEYNDKGFMVYADNYPGSFTRAKTKDEALLKLAADLDRFISWMNDLPFYKGEYEIDIVQEQQSKLNIEDGDTDIIFASEKNTISKSEYNRLKALAIKSATDFEKLYNSIPDINLPLKQARECFHGNMPVSAREMYYHTKDVNSYYFGELGVDIGNGMYMRNSRMAGFMGLESIDNFLHMPAVLGSYDEEWSVRKLLRRFIWHDRIHAKAMYKHSAELFGKEHIANPFKF